MTITEYGNSVPYTEKQDDLSLHPVKEVIAKVLKNDAKKAFDIAAYNQFNATPLTVAPTAGTATDVVTLTTNGTVTITNNVALASGGRGGLTGRPRHESDAAAPVTRLAALVRDGQDLRPMGRVFGVDQRVGKAVEVVDA